MKVKWYFVLLDFYGKIWNFVFFNYSFKYIGFDEFWEKILKCVVEVFVGFWLVIFNRVFSVIRNVFFSDFLFREVLN